MSQRDPFSGMTAFIKAAESNSFSVAARSLGLTPSAVSKTVTRLEQSMGVKLFHRSPRAVTLTTDGENFYHRCSDVLTIVEDARAVVTGDEAITPGKLRVALPISYGQQVVAPNLPRWQQDNPNVLLELILSDRHVDIVQERFDLAVRFDQVPDSRLVAKKLPRQIFITAASPAYLRRAGIPQNVSDLERHNCLGYIDKQTNLPRPWHFVKNTEESGKQLNGEGDKGAQKSVVTPGIAPLAIIPKGNVVSDQGTFLLNVAIAGGGVIHGPDYLLEESLASKQLVPILNQYHSEGPNWWIVYPYSRHPSGRLRRFLVFLESL